MQNENGSPKKNILSAQVDLSKYDSSYFRAATEEEKKKYKNEIEICGGFLKTIDYKDAWRLAWNKASIEERKKLFELPNWDNEVFKEITGIDAEKEILLN